MCSGRVDLDFILRAFSMGQDGVFVGGCRLGECNYITHGNYDALGNVYLCKKMLAAMGINTERLRIDFISGADGNLLAEYSDAFIKKIKALGPLGREGGMGKEEVKFKLEAARKLVPFVKLTERERLRAPEKTEQAYKEFYESDAVNALIDSILTEKLAISQILLLLGQTPLSTSDISERLGMNPSDVSRYMITSSKHGMVRYDTASKCYTLTQ